MTSDINNLIRNFIERCRTENEKPLLVLLGPTASGKTALSIEIAEKFNGEIISADSRQVYKYMDIGTDKISKEKRKGIPHYLIDIIEPTERFTVADFKKTAEAVIDEILKRGKLPMLVGGTGLYLRSITQNFMIPPENPSVRKKLLEELETRGGAELYKKLQNLDPFNAAKIHPNSIPYVIRALEIFMTTGKPKRDSKLPARYSCLQIGLFAPREILFERIHKRINEQMKRGLVEETQKLLDMGYRKNLPCMKSLGYKEMVAYLSGEISLNEAVEMLKQNTRNFAKRQMTWFKKDKEIIWMRI